jgi:hypothetical protein
MTTSIEIRQKLATLIGHLVSRCIREARMIPTVLHREEMINLLMDDPDMFAKLVREEHADNAALSKDDLTVKMDAVAELAKLDSLEVFEQSYWEESEVDLAPVLDLTNQLTRTFAVYLGNSSTLFDREFEEFMIKFRSSLQKAGMTIKAVDFTVDDCSAFVETAISYLEAGDLLQAFTFDKLLSSQIMMKQVVNLPAAGFSLRETLIKHALEDQRFASALIKFALRISYISHGAWEDLVPMLTKIIYQEPGLITPEQLIDYVEQDIVFSCNLLCRSYTEIRHWIPVQRRQEIELRLKELGK